MNYSGLGLAALDGTVAYFAFGFLVLRLVPALINEAHKYRAVFRPKEQMTLMPIGNCQSIVKRVVRVSILPQFFLSEYAFRQPLWQ